MRGSMAETRGQRQNFSTGGWSDYPLHVFSPESSGVWQINSPPIWRGEEVPVEGATNSGSTPEK